jgi:alkylation response protein AidB-like acyl-CoA dehydrogenase
MILDLLSQVRERMLTPEKLREWDRDEIFPETEIRELLGPEIGLQLLFIPEEYGGMGGGARDLAAFPLEMGKICLGVATAFLVVHLGTDPILVAATPDQKRKWLKKVAEGAIVAYAVPEPEAGSNLSNLKTSATPVLDESGTLTGYRINGSKQFISNGGYADFLTVLAQAPEGPTFFIVERTMPGFCPGRAEEKHGIRSSNTVALTFDDVFVPAENLVGGEPGHGLAQANEVFGFTRLMVACLGLAAGEAALEKVIPYAKERVQFGSPLIDKQGYTHKLVLPFVAKLAASRAYIEEVALRLDSGESDLQPEGAIASCMPPRSAMPVPTRPSKPWVDTATYASTTWRRSSATSRSPTFTRAPARYNNSSSAHSAGVRPSRAKAPSTMGWRRTSVRCTTRTPRWVPAPWRPSPAS